MTRERLGLTLVLASSLFVFACRREAPAPKREVASTRATARPPDVTPETPAIAAALDAIERIDEAPDDEIAAMPSPLRTVTPPARGCAIASRAPTRISQVAGAPSIAADDGGSVIAHYAARGDGEDLVVVSLVPARAPRPLARVHLAKPRAFATRVPPGLGIVGPHRAGVAWVDGDDVLSFAVISTNGTAPGLSPRVLARDVDARFPPAVASLGRTFLVAYVAKGRIAHTTVVAFEESGRERTHDVTAESGGAAAPVFVEGASSPTLVIVDPREGFSPISRIGFDEGGVPRAPVVVRPVTSLYDPARIAVAEGRGDLEIGYAAHAAALATAIGYFRGAPTAPAPVSLVRPTGFGALWVDAAPSPTGAVFAALTPLGPEPSSPRGLLVRVSDADGLGPPLTHGEGLAFPSIAALSPGLYAIAYATPRSVEALFVRCSTIVIPSL